jgi:uncharacterized damage-inducible protein DinB
MKEQLLSAWKRNNQVNQALIRNTSEKGWQCTLSTRGGRTIFQQWVHINKVRLQWLEVCSKEIFSQTFSNQEPADSNSLLDELDKSAKAYEQLFSESWDNNGKVKGFKTGLMNLFAYLITHEAHHRGNILLTLKQCGEKIPDAVKWNLWEWNR